MKYKDRVIYECKNFPPGGYSTIMLFGFIFTKKSWEEFCGRISYHESFHLYQYRDCFGLGLAIAIVLMFVLFAFNICEWWMLSLISIPLLLFYAWYGVNFVKQYIKYGNWDDAYKNIIFERQAYALQDEWMLSCDEKTRYTSFSFLKY